MSAHTDTKVPFIEHVYELRKRLFYMAISVTFWAFLAYWVQHQIINILLKPLGEEKLISTSVIGGIDFLFRITIYVGIVFSLPVIIYNVLRYLQPLIKESWRFVFTTSVLSGILAVIGMVFGYYFGLPAALHFLLNQFRTDQIEALVTIQSYMGFITFYMFGASLLFQVPLVLLFINRIVRLKPNTLFSLKVQRWVILGAFVLGFLMNPSPNIIEQLLVIGPMIPMYQFGILLIWYTNRLDSHKLSLLQMYEHDAQLRDERLRRREAAKLYIPQDTVKSDIARKQHPKKRRPILS